MNQNTELVLALLRTAFASDGRGNVNFDAFDPSVYSPVFRIFKQHDLAHLLNRCVKGAQLNIDAEMQKRLEAIENQAIFRYFRIAEELKNTSKVLEEGEIPFMPLKGSVLRELYPEPWMRTSCDIDIHVHEEDVDRAVACLTAAGYQIGERGFHDIAITTPLGVTLELHYMLVEQSESAYGVLSRVWDTATLAQGYRFRYEMTSEMFVLFHIAHMAKHFVDGGCGVRPFVDLWVIKNKMNYDASALDALLSECSLSSFGKAVMALSDAWLSSGEHSPLTEEMENYIMSSGVYGTTENRVAIAQANRGGKFKYLMTRLFPPFSRMAQRYPRLRTCPILLPWYYLVRWFSFLGKDKQGAMNELRHNASISEDKQARLVNMCEELGLV